MDNDFVVKFGKKAKKYFKRSFTKRINIAEGAVRSGKTVTNVFAFAEALEEAPEQIHLATGVTTGAAKLIIGHNNGYGLEAHFQGRFKWGRHLDNEALFVDTYENGQKIILFMGGGKANSADSLTGKSIGMWIATEINLHHKNFIKEARRRMVASKYYKIFWDLNPGFAGHFFYKDIINQIKIAGKDDANHYQYTKFTLFDNVALTDEQIQRTLLDYNGPQDPWYRRDILGELLALEGAVYKDFDRRAMAVKNIPFKPLAFAIGIDWGYSASGTAAVLIATDYTNICVVCEERHTKERSSSDNIKIAQAFIKRVAPVAILPTILPDNADAGLCRDFKRSMPMQRILTKYKKPPILQRINLMHYMLQAGRFTYIAHNCPNLADALENALWTDNRQNERQDIDDIDKNNDTIDAMEYAIIPFAKYLRASLLGGARFGKETTQDKKEAESQEKG